MQLFTLRDGEARPALAVGPLPRHLGRSPENDLVLDDPTVSAEHATVWLDEGRAWIRDRGSRNGTFVNGERVQRLAELHDGDAVRIGSVDLVVRGSADRAAPRRASTWLLEDLDAEVRYPFRGGRLVLGAGEGADVRLDVTEDEEVALTVQPEGEIWRTTLEAEGPLAVGEELALGGRRFRVVEATVDLGRTVELDAPGSEYRLEVTLQGVAGAEAVLIDPAANRRYVVDAENRAVLLYLLARARTEGGTGDEAGWVADDEVSVGIWGRKGVTDANSLHVLVHRLRKELKKAGFEPWFLEKRRKAIRIALDDVVLK